MTASFLKKPLTRRPLMIVSALLIGLPLLVIVSMTLIEPNIIAIENIDIELKNFPGRIRAVQLSDLHMHGRTDFMKRVQRKIADLKPEYIFLTGDLVDDKNDLLPCLEFLKRLPPCKGIFFVPGNWEHWSGTWQDGLKDQLEKIGVTVLINEGHEISVGEGRFYLAGIDDSLAGSPNLDQILRERIGDTCTILLSHAPVIADRLDGAGVDLILTGHTHGGQIRLPFIGALRTPPGSGIHQAGFYRSGKTLLYVNRGLGLSVIPCRLFCPPEITSFLIHSN